ncbi:SLAP domain-containing protein [Ornithinibacillus californiensis]|uniref:SLAP domain-containing protein n=1 Tax=Ornithinibacillus californiensis TaxID=161536 RepID=UPI00064D8433|nr:SLAP domain-containing protein [Ornithinibacillus californiensis]
MQTLKLEATWEKAISEKDRSLVQRVFEQESFNGEPIQFTPLRMDRNYKGELLVIVIVHNTTDEEKKFMNDKISLVHGEVTLAEYVFTLPNLVVEAKTSIPWTFIFPVGSYKDSEGLSEGVLKIFP